MSLEELQENWNALKEESFQNTLSEDHIKKVLNRKYYVRLAKLFFGEIVMLLIYLYFIVLIFFQFDQLEKNYLEILGVVSIILLVALFILRSIKLVVLYKWNFWNQSYAAVIKILAQQKTKLQQFYIIHQSIGFLLLMSLSILSIKIYNEYEVIKAPYFWLISIIGSIIFLFSFGKWIINSYDQTIKEAKALLHEVEN